MNKTLQIYANDEKNKSIGSAEACLLFALPAFESQVGYVSLVFHNW